MPASRPGRGSGNEEGPWGFGVGRISEGLGALRHRKLARGLGHGLHLKTLFPLEQARGEGKKVKTKS